MSASPGQDLNLLLFDALESRPAPLQLKAGPLRMLYEPDTGFLRYLSVGDFEIVRAIYFAVRNSDWDTLPPSVTPIRFEVQNESFSIEYKAGCDAGGIQFSWRGYIDGASDGTVSYRAEGSALTDFLSNRVSLCVLHPMAECAGKPCQISTPGKGIKQAAFPKEITRGAVFSDIAALRHEVAPGVDVLLQFEGEIFETEDQRNWTDGSFKTYAPTLEKPIPARFQKDQVVAQKVTLKIEGPAGKILPVVHGRPPQISITTNQIFALPPIGFCLPQHVALSDWQKSQLKILKPSHLRLDLDLESENSKANLQQAISLAEEFSAQLHLAAKINLSRLAALSELVSSLSTGQRQRIGLWILFSEEGELLEERDISGAMAQLGLLTPKALFTSGTTGNFADINDADSTVSGGLIAYSMMPQVHCIDYRSMVETLAAQPQTVQTIYAKTKKSVVLSPVSLKGRSFGGANLVEMDPRQKSLFGAAWTLASLSKLASTSQIHSLTFFETHGRAGLMEGGGPETSGGTVSREVFPLFHVFAAMAEWFPAKVHPTQSTHPLWVEALALVNSRNQQRILVANLSAEEQEIKIKAGSCKARIKLLSGENVLEAMQRPESFRAAPAQEVESVTGKLSLQLSPFAVAQVDIL